MRRVFALLVLLGSLRAGAPGSSHAAPAPRDVRVAAAADLTFVLDAVFEAAGVPASGLRPVVTYGSSGSFTTQIENGAPFDLFLSADADYPRRLAAKGLADGDVFLYAEGRITLWVPSSSSLDVRALGLRALLDPAVRKVAIANPRHAPYGRAAVAAMKDLGVYGAVSGKLVLGENAAQAAQFVQGGAADAGIVAMALALAPRMRDAGRFVEVPLRDTSLLEQGGIVLRGARDPAAARTLRDALLGPRGREILGKRGFRLPSP